MPTAEVLDSNPPGSTYCTVLWNYIQDLDGNLRKVDWTSRTAVHTSFIPGSLVSLDGYRGIVSLDGFAYRIAETQEEETPAALATETYQIGDIIESRGKFYVKNLHGNYTEIDSSSASPYEAIGAPGQYTDTHIIANTVNGPRLYNRILSDTETQATTEPDEVKTTDKAAGVIAKFLDATPTVCKHMVRAGFELETQSSDGVTSKDGDEIAEEALDEAITDRVDEILSDTGHLENILSSRLWDRVREEVYTDVRDNINTSDYMLESHLSLNDTYGDRYLEVGKDGTVQGFEWRTKGGLTYQQFNNTLKKVIRVGHEVDSGCSFHVHVSLQGVKHQYGERMQAAMVEYVVNNRHRLPASAQKRIAGTKDNIYIQGLFSSREKYSFVNYHRQGTWEFRCFGAIDTVEGGMECLKVAIEALQFAYLVSRRKQPLLTDKYKGDKKNLIYKVLAKGLDLKTELRELSALERNAPKAVAPVIAGEVTGPYLSALSFINNAESLRVGSVLGNESVQFVVESFAYEGEYALIKQIAGVPMTSPVELASTVKALINQLPELNIAYYESLAGLVGGAATFSRCEVDAWNYGSVPANTPIGGVFYSRQLMLLFEVVGVSGGICRLRQLAGGNLDYSLVGPVLRREGLLVSQGPIASDHDEIPF